MRSKKLPVAAATSATEDCAGGRCAGVVRSEEHHRSVKRSSSNAFGSRLDRKSEGENVSRLYPTRRDTRVARASFHPQCDACRPTTGARDSRSGETLRSNDGCLHPASVLQRLRRTAERSFPTPNATAASTHSSGPSHDVDTRRALGRPNLPTMNRRARPTDRVSSRS
jgi:hypothetical protein